MCLQPEVVASIKLIVIQGSISASSHVVLLILQPDFVDAIASLLCQHHTPLPIPFVLA